MFLAKVRSTTVFIFYSLLLFLLTFSLQSLLIGHLSSRMWFLFFSIFKLFNITIRHLLNTIVAIVFYLIMDQTEFRWIHNQKENGHCIRSYSFQFESNQKIISLKVSGLPPKWNMFTHKLRKLCFHFFSHWMGYDRGDSFDFEPNGIPFGSKSKGKLSSRLYPI